MMDRIEMLKKTNYYFITDSRSSVSTLDQVKIAVESGVKMIQYRDKSKSDREKYDDLIKINKICGEKSLLIVNDRVDLALSTKADGVHLGQDDLPPKKVKKLSEDLILGISTHNKNQAKKAEKIADYVALGPLFETDTKKNPDPELGIKRACRIAESIEVPTVAIGGIGKKDIPEIIGPFDIICAVSSVTRSGNISKNVEDFEKEINIFKEGKNGKTF